MYYKKYDTHNPHDVVDVADCWLSIKLADGPSVVRHLSHTSRRRPATQTPVAPATRPSQHLHTSATSMSYEQTARAAASAAAAASVAAADDATQG